MNLKRLDPKSHKEIAYIHKKHFKDEFELSDIFSDKVLNQFVIADADDRVVAFGGIKLLFELVLVTDLDRSPRDRVTALKLLLDSLISESRRKEFEQLHCFVTHHDDNWIKILEKVGFAPTKGKSLYMNL